jgi:hypothetical protein
MAVATATSVNVKQAVPFFGVTNMESSLRRQMPEILENADEKLTTRMRRLLDFLWQEWKHLQLQIESWSEDLELIANSDEACARLQQIPGSRPLGGHGCSLGYRERSGLSQGTRVCGLAGSGTRAAVDRREDEAVGHQSAGQSVSAQDVHSWGAGGGVTCQTRRIVSRTMDEGFGRQSRPQYRDCCHRKQAGQDQLGGVVEWRKLSPDAGSCACQLDEVTLKFVSQKSAEEQKGRKNSQMACPRTCGVTRVFHDRRD